MDGVGTAFDGSMSGGVAGEKKDLVSEMGDRIGNLGVELADVSGRLDDVTTRVVRQADQFQVLNGLAERMVSGNRSIDEAVAATQQVASAAGAQIAETQSSAAAAVAIADELVGAVRRVEERLGSFSGVLDQVSKVSAAIETIAKQTRLLALNATIEAARAGEAGRGFAVVAGEVKSLSNETRNATGEIRAIVESLSNQISQLIGEAGAAAARAKEVGVGAAEMREVVAKVEASFAAVGQEIERIARSAGDNLSACDGVLAEVRDLADGVGHASDSLQEANKRVGALVGLSGTLMEQVVESGAETADTALITAVMDGARLVSEALEGAIERGETTMDALFSKDYQEIEGSDPKQYLAGYLDVAERLLPPIQNGLLALDPRIAFCAPFTTDGYIPVHNPEYSKPQGKDPVWNAAHCRNRQFRKDAAARRAGNNASKRFLFQTYRRDMGGGKSVLMKDISAPIFIRGRLWGALRMGVN